jgi:hypothetical protein
VPETRPRLTNARYRAKDLNLSGAAKTCLRNLAYIVGSLSFWISRVTDNEDVLSWVAVERKERAHSFGSAAWCFSVDGWRSRERGD